MAAATVLSPLDSLPRTMLPAPAAPAEDRFAERLAASEMTRAELIRLAAQACHALPDARRFADACLAVHDPLPAPLRNGVILSPDLLPHLLKTLAMEDCAAASACKAWSAAWSVHAAALLLRPVPCPAFEFELHEPSALAALPDGERLCIADPRAERV